MRELQGEGLEEEFIFLSLHWLQCNHVTTLNCKGGAGRHSHWETGQPSPSDTSPLEERVPIFGK